MPIDPKNKTAAQAAFGAGWDQAKAEIRDGVYEQERRDGVGWEKMVERAESLHRLIVKYPLPKEDE